MKFLKKIMNIILKEKSFLNKKINKKSPHSKKYKTKKSNETRTHCKI